MCVCKNCMKVGGIVFLVLGILFLLQDLKVWDFWNISWYTAVLVAVGVGHLGSAHCPNCEAVRTGKMGKK